MLEPLVYDSIYAGKKYNILSKTDSMSSDSIMVQSNRHADKCNKSTGEKHDLELHFNQLVASRAAKKTR